MIRLERCDAMRYDPIMTHRVKNVKPLSVRISLERKFHSVYNGPRKLYH